jgi:putative ABC transport system permease protein
MFDSVVNVFSMSLAFTLIGLNVYLSTNVLNVTDLTCDASVTLGGCAYGALVVCGISPLIAVLVSMLLGAIAGFTTSSFVINIKIEPVLASIITLTAMQTFILKFSFFESVGMEKMGNRAILMLPALDNFIIALVIVSALGILFFKMMNSEYGLAMRVYGDGKIISESLGINSNQMLAVGLSVGNAMSAIAGALIAQISGRFFSGMGNGSLVFGLAALIIGERLISGKTIKGAIIGCFVGAFVYKVTMEMVIFSGAETLGSEYNSIITAVILIFLMALIQDSKIKEITY